MLCVRGSGCFAVEVACETCTKDNMVMVFGEITTKAKLDYDTIVRQAVADIGSGPERALEGPAGMDAGRVAALWRSERRLEGLRVSDLL